MSDEEQVQVLDAVPGLDPLHRRPVQFRALGELLLGEVRVLARLTDVLTLLLAGEADPLGLISGHPSTLKPG